MGHAPGVSVSARHWPPGLSRDPHRTRGMAQPQPGARAPDAFTCSGRPALGRIPGIGGWPGVPASTENTAEPSLKASIPVAMCVSTKKSVNSNGNTTELL